MSADNSARRQVIDLTEIGASMLKLVGGKAAGLGEMIRAGFRVPDGFCLTTDAHTADMVPADQLADAYARLGGGPVAVRSSATAEDLPDASFAGQQDTFLNVQGTGELLDAVRRCWESLRSDRAVAYRQANEIDGESAHMAVVVQRMVDPRVAGVLFTANPITGSRTEMVIDAAPGLGTAVVDGTVIPDHYVLGDVPTPEGGCLGRDDLAALREAGTRLQRHFGSPQDVEWAIDHDGTLWVLQSRPVTTLFPLPPATGRPLPRVYFEVGHMQGMLRPFTPAGMSALQLATKQYLDAYDLGDDTFGGTMGTTWVGGRFYLDLTEMLRSKRTRRRLPQMMELYGPRCVAIAERLLEDPRFYPQRALPFRLAPILRLTLRLLPTAAVEIARTLARPAAARNRAFGHTEKIRRQTSAPAELTTAERLRFAEDVQMTFMGPEASAIVWPLMVGILVSQAPRALLKGIASDAELDTALGGLPHNVTTEMDLALWRLASGLGEQDRELLRTTSPSELTRLYRQGELPDIGLDSFLAKYGHRAAAEIDVGVPRWSEDPTPILANLAGYLQITDPEQAPDRRFAKAAARAEAKIDELVERAQRQRPIRARLARFFFRRSRELTGLRELGKFAWLYSLGAMREQLLLIGEDLVARGLLDHADDVMFLELGEIHAAVRGADHRNLVTERKALHKREMRRRSIPVALLSDGTDLEAAAPAPDSGDQAMKGMSASPGKATGRARVIHDPANDARIEPGEILVAPTTDPGWTPLFMTAAGLVTETGSPMAHGPTVAREYGIPAVICVRNATTEITTGQLVTIDGATGTVTLEP